MGDRTEGSIVVDAPPTNRNVLGPALSKKVDGVVLVVEAEPDLLPPPGGDWFDRFLLDGRERLNPGRRAADQEFDARALALAAGQRGLEHVGGVDRPFRSTSTDQCVEFVDEQDRIFRAAD